MSVLTPVVDHVVINVADDLDNAAQVYQVLGFQLTPRGYHSLGTSNHLAIFGENYLELLGHKGGYTGRQGNGWPAQPGLSGLVWKTGGADADEIYRHLQRVGLAGAEPEYFYRPVTLPDDSQGEARFRTVRLAPERINNGRSFFCQHLTPELVWQAPWREHPNGVTDIIGVAIAAQDPFLIADVYSRLFDGNAPLHSDGAGGYWLCAGKTTLSFVTPLRARDIYGPAACGDNGAERMVALELAVSSLAHTEKYFRRARLAYRTEGQQRRLFIPAGEAFNVALAFREA